MKIETLGPGCSTCDALYAEAQRAIGASITQYRFVTTPAMVLDGRVKASGRIPDLSEIVLWIRSAAARQRA